MGYRGDGVRIPILFYADYGLLLARGVEEAEGIMELLEVRAAGCGLNINRGKSCCMIFNARGENLLGRGGAA